MHKRFARHGKALVTWVVVAAVVTLAIVAGVALLGTNTDNKLNQTATDVADPHALTQRFGS